MHTDQLTELLEGSFSLWQQMEQGFTQGWDRSSLQSDVGSLLNARLLDQEPDGRLTLTELGRYASESGIEVRSVTQVASLLRYAPPTLSAAALVVAAQVTLELDDTYIRTNDRSHQEQARWRNTLAQLGAPQQLADGLHVGGGRVTLRCKRAAACLLLMTRSSFAEIESNLLQHTPDRSAAGPIRQVAGRTRDVISIVANIAVLSGKTLAPGLSIDDLGLQLELGLPRESLEIARLSGASLTRGDYLALLNSGYLTWQQVSSTDESVLTELVGPLKARLLMDTASDVMRD